MSYVSSLLHTSRSALHDQCPCLMLVLHRFSQAHANYIFLQTLIPEKWWISDSLFWRRYSTKLIIRHSFVLTTTWQTSSVICELPTSVWWLQTTSQSQCMKTKTGQYRRGRVSSRWLQGPLVKVSYVQNILRRIHQIKNIIYDWGKWWIFQNFLKSWLHNLVFRNCCILTSYNNRFLILFFQFWAEENLTYFHDWNFHEVNHTLMFLNSIVHKTNILSISFSDDSRKMTSRTGRG